MSSSVADLDTSDPESAQWRRPVPPLDVPDRWYAGGLFVLGVLSWSFGQSLAPDQPAAWLSVLLIALVTLPLLWRRLYSIPVMAVVTVSYIVFGELQVPELIVGQVAMFASIYAVGAWEPNRARALWSRVTVIVVMTVWLLVSFFRLAADGVTGSGIGVYTPLAAAIAINILINVLYFTGAWWFGDHAWQAARQIALIDAKTAALRAEQERARRQALTIERMRVARELHDSVAHHVSLMGVQAAAARAVLPTDQARAAAVLEQLEEAARSAVTELYGILGTLRSDDAEPDPTPVDVGQLPELVEQSRAGGLIVDLQEIGTPRPLAPGVSLTLYRVAQESLTNALKHAGPGTAVQLRLRWTADSVELEVSDDAGGRPVAGRAKQGAGMGLSSMSERVNGAGGKLHVGPRIDAGYLVRARFGGAR